MRTLYPPITPYAEQRLAVDGLHTLQIYECGNPDGIPVVFLHGGPGGGVVPEHRRFFDPQRWRVVLFDQRGCGLSTPQSEVRDNTTAHLVADIEAIRAHLGIARWAVFGGSWGSTLSLAYAQAHPDRVLGLVLRGIFLGRREELHWCNECDGGAQMVFPEGWARYVAHIPEAERAQMVEAYWRRLDDEDAGVRQAAAEAWAAWEDGSSTLVHDANPPPSEDDVQATLAVARIEAHYFRHDVFLQPNQLLRDIDRIRHLPGTIVQGRYDMLCPAKAAYELAQAWPEARLEMVLAGHSAFDPAITDALVRATDALADTLARPG
ncbi:prolyl aminopeptidase [Pseudoxanthomonas sp.]|uniref:prolyl aminopeptidase n=1 Tax=Pseudoxanthomonas sp. TaxID=1871049 RepID=UPI00261288D8|nr:prolyl aminopeptidase [Pseudoxanthomonas sp.]WDS37909.1 MAG: prolyl aminopeptidase [Pseudoxanthomonas sp.]